ncbi:MAG: DMT family transporter [Actinobacteria bacterium]|nr:DMT family transporter [Actinomycetota bacterium]
MAFYRNALAVAILVPAALALHRDELRGLSRGQWAAAVASGALLAAHFALWIPSLSFISVGASTVLVTTQPVWVALLGRFLGERIEGRTLLGAGLSVAGALAIFGGDLGSSNLRGDSLALGGAAAAAGYYLAGRSLRRRVSLLTYVAICYSTCAAILAIAVAAAGQPFAGFPPKVWVLFVLMALGPQIMGHTVFNYLLSDVPAPVIATAITAEPIGATLLALAFFAEVPPWTALVGGALILSGIAVTVRAQADVTAPVE